MGQPTHITPNHLYTLLTFTRQRIKKTNAFEKKKGCRLENKSQKIARLNDAFRKSGQRGRIYATPGIQALQPGDQLEVLNLVKTFNDFSEGNDPYGEHDFGSFAFKGDKVFWKIDYFDTDMQHGSEDPSDPEKTVRVMTVMMSWEY